MKSNVVLFCGDVATSPYSCESFRNGDLETLFNDILPLMQNTDNVIVNLECALTEKDTKIKKIGPNLKSPIETAETLKKAGVTACGLANNHSFDYGLAGMKDTFAALDAAGIAHFGSGYNEEEACKPYFFEAGDKKIAVIAVVEHEYTFAIDDRPGAARFDPFDTMVRIRDAKKEADYVVIMYHGAKEQCEYPSPRMRKACRAFAEFGADLVLCQHSHIIGTVEHYGDSVFVYGQGNFHFIKYLNFKGWDTGLIARVTFGDKMDVELLPVGSDENGIFLLTGEEGEKIMADMEARNRTIEDGTWIKGWEEFVESKKESYTKVVYDAGHGEDPDYAIEYFAHYLACEAHTDVWRTLFPNWHAAGLSDTSEEA